MNKAQLQHLWTIACKNSSVDFETNNLSIHGIIEEITLQNNTPEQAINELAKGKLIVPLEFEVINMWRKLVPAEKELVRDARMEIIDPKGELIQVIEYKLDFKAGIERLRSRVKLNGFPVSGPGEHIFVVKADIGAGGVEKVGELSIPVKIKFPLKQKAK